MGRIAVKYGKWILVASVILLVISILLSSRLQMVTNFTNLMPSENLVLKAQLDFENTFGLGERVYVVFEGSKEERHTAIDAIKERFDLTTKVVDYYAGNETTDGVLAYLDSANGTTTMVIVEPNIDTNEFAKSRKDFFDYLQSTISELESGQDSGALQIGFTGGNFVQDDEADRVMEEGIFGTLFLTLAAIIGCVVIAFKKVKLPLALGYPLFFGVALTAAVGYLIFSEFNLFSVFFAVVLFGLGIDFGVHLLARYFEEIKLGKSIEESITTAIKTTGASIVIGALTTAGAFYSFTFTEFKGFQQMGTLAGTGILILAMSMLILVPCMIPILHKSKLSEATSKQVNDLPQYSLKVVAVVTVILILVGVWGTGSQKYTFNMQEIYPKEMSSTRWQAKLEKAYDTRLTDLTVKVKGESVVHELVEVLENRSDIEEVVSVFTFLPEGMTLEQALPYLPAVLKDQYIANDVYRIDIKSTGDIWDRAYYNELNQVVASITGEQIVGFSAIMIALGEVVIKDVVSVSLLCLAVIVVLLVLLFRKPKYVVLAFAPMLLSTVTTFGLMHFLSIPLNIISIVAFPMIIGISIDSSVHLVHRLTHEPSGISETLKAISLTGITTILGFGALATINHRGLSSLGATVALGMLISLLVNISVFGILGVRSNAVESKDTSGSGAVA
ncbi:MULTISPECIES: RND family transporter [unclassified Fusibacter]|uniref:efflux RND transporter permease subunit n=1 Tax=unclassified Fusibacter TaxID=2624464 RepID=UPI0010138042|nr:MULTISPECIES: MMPL family transporter [unclassified Fusibacter]MCK8058208.1 MMPL family transporter [Fusibacter sp. A2]NPE20791.1 MMPL family transporter [Fusibacter sp. A1]RXV62997.1 hypothetical protein DWB64_03090 [Fusibacter sp. A1]